MDFGPGEKTKKSFVRRGNRKINGPVLRFAPRADRGTFPRRSVPQSTRSSFLPGTPSQNQGEIAFVTPFRQQQLLSGCNPREDKKPDRDLPLQPVLVRGKHAHLLRMELGGKRSGSLRGGEHSAVFSLKSKTAARSGSPSGRLGVLLQFRTALRAFKPWPYLNSYGARHEPESPLKPGQGQC